MNLRWNALLVPTLLISVLLLGASQYAFLQGSFFRDLPFGRSGTDFEFTNYIKIFTDPFYLNALWLTVETSAIAALLTLLMGFPVAYVIARMRSRLASLMLAGVVVATFVTIVIKVYGIMVIFGANGGLNRLLLWAGLITEPYSPLGTVTGVVIGLMHFTLGFGVVLLYSIVHTIPRSFEEAAQIHGASRLRVFTRVVLPLCLPGLIAGGLMVFNMCMGAFTSAALLGGGRIFTLPVLIQRTVIMETKYGMGGALSAVLLIAALLINLLSIVLLRRLRSARQVLA